MPRPGSKATRRLTSKESDLTEDFKEVSIKTEDQKLEMTSDEIVNKIIGIRAGVNTQKIEMGNITNEEYKRIQQATIEYHEGNLILIDDQTTLEQISNTVRKLIRRIIIERI